MPEPAQALAAATQFQAGLEICNLPTKKTECIVRVFTEGEEDVPVDEFSHGAFDFLQGMCRHALITGHVTQAKTFTSALLQQCFDTDSTGYRSFACLLASASSNGGQGFSGIVVPTGPNGEMMDDYRQDTVALLDIVFKSIRLGHVLINESGSNIYRLAYCMRAVGGDSGGCWPTVYATFSFLLQLCLISYVLLHLLTKDREVKLPHLPLAVLFATFTTVVLSRGVSQSLNVRRLFWAQTGYNALYFIDMICNVVIPILVVPAGALLIAGAKDLMDAVLNSVALTFITEIDDQMPSVLGLPESEILKQYVMRVAVDILEKFIFAQNQWVRLPRDVPQPALLDLVLVRSFKKPLGNFCVPQAVMVDAEGQPSLFLSRYVTKDCLLKRVEFNLGTLDGFSCVSYLKLWKLDGSDPIEIGKQDGSLQLHVIDAVVFITDFYMSNAIWQLRLFGARTFETLVRDLEYYTLWDVDYGVRNMSLPKPVDPYDYDPLPPLPSTRHMKFSLGS